MSMGRGEEKLTARSLFRKMIKSDYMVLLPLHPLPFPPPSPPPYTLFLIVHPCVRKEGKWHAL